MTAAAPNLLDFKLDRFEADTELEYFHALSMRGRQPSRQPLGTANGLRQFGQPASSLRCRSLIVR